MKKVILWFGKLIIASIISAGILSAVFALYFNYGTRVVNEDETSDYRWKPGFYAQWYEGYGIGFHDENGFNNAFEVAEDKDIDIILMGSSQMEGNNVYYKNNTAYLMNDIASTNNIDLYTYSIAMEGHTIDHQIHNLKNALEQYRSSYVILENRILTFDRDAINAALNDDLYEPLSFRDSSKLAHYAKMSPFVKIMYAQYKSVKANSLDEEDTAKIFEIVRNESIIYDVALPASEDFDINSIDYEELLASSELTGISQEQYDVIDMTLSYISDTCNEYGVIPIFLYFPEAHLTGGDYTFDYDKWVRAYFAALCDKYGVIFVDMTEEFTENYKENYIIPFGFTNTKLGQGHLNKYGHEMIASKIMEMIATDKGGND